MWPDLERPPMCQDALRRALLVPRGPYHALDNRWHGPVDEHRAGRRSTSGGTGSHCNDLLLGAHRRKAAGILA